MQNRDNHHAANELRLSILLPALLILLLGLLTALNFLSKKEIQSEDPAHASVRPTQKPSQETDVPEVSPAPIPPEDLHSLKAVPEIKRSEPAKNVVPIPIDPPPVVTAVATSVPKRSSLRDSAVSGGSKTPLKEAVVAGTITVRGRRPPPNPVIDLSSNPDCGKLHPENPTQPFFLVGNNGGLADVVVSVKDFRRKSLQEFEPGEHLTPLAIEQRGCMYFPYISAVQTGQSIEIKNSDSFLHNVHPTPSHSGNKEQNVAQFPNKVDEFVFSHPESFLRFKCDIHPWMFAYVSVFDHPYFAVTDTNGNFVLQGLPVGQYTIEAAHRKAGVLTKQVQIKRREDRIKLKFEFSFNEQPRLNQQTAKATP